jgi:hypothetical protein
MSTYRACDYCSQPIEPDDTFVSLSMYGRAWPPDGGHSFCVNDTVGDYHSEPRDGEPSCYRRVLDALALAETTAALERIPTATPQKIAALRRRHHGGKR